MPSMTIRAVGYVSITVPQGGELSMEVSAIGEFVFLVAPRAHLVYLAPVEGVILHRGIAHGILPYVALLTGRGSPLFLLLLFLHVPHVTAFQVGGPWVIVAEGYAVHGLE